MLQRNNDRRGCSGSVSGSNSKCSSSNSDSDSGSSGSGSSDSSSSSSDSHRVAPVAQRRALNGDFMNVRGFLLCNLCHKFIHPPIDGHFEQVHNFSSHFDTTGFLSLEAAQLFIMQNITHEAFPMFPPPIEGFACEGCSHATSTEGSMKKHKQKCKVGGFERHWVQRLF